MANQLYLVQGERGVEPFPQKIVTYLVRAPNAHSAREIVTEWRPVLVNVVSEAIHPERGPLGIVFDDFEAHPTDGY